MNRKALAVLCSSALAVGGMFVATASTPSKAAVTSGPFSAWATGTAEHVQAIDAPPTRAVDAEAAFSRAGTSSAGLSAVNNELGEAVVPKDLETQAKAPIGPFHSYGGGSAIEAGLGTTIPNNPDVNQIILGGLAEQAADPPTPAGDVTNDPATNGFVTKDLINITQANPLLYANALRGQGRANWSDNNGANNPCGASQPLGFGLGHAADAQLLNSGSIGLPLPGSTPVIATDQTPNPPGNNPGAADESRSFTSLVPDPAHANHFIVHSETRQILAPVTLFKGTPNEVTIQIGGEWVLKADASGTNGGAHITYAPEGAPTPTTPILRVIQNGKVAGSLTTQDILTNKGLNISLPPNPAPPAPPAPPILLEISLGEPAHLIGNTNAPATQTTDGTNASGAVDVARVKVLNALPQFQLADVRVGHMEVNAQAPVGGVTCSGPSGSTTTTGGNGSTTTTGGNNGSTTTTTANNGSTTTTAANNGSTTTTRPANPGGNTTTSTEPPNQGNNTTTTTAGNNNRAAATTTTTGPAQVQAVTFSQSPAATPQSQTPNFTG
jgi:hypothetical protein